MGLKIIVAVKQVPDTHDVSGEAMKPDGTVNRAALPAVFNPEDLHALELGLRIKDRLGGSLTALSMGPPKAVEVLRECLFRGADDLVLLSDRRFAGSDTLATSYVLACAIRRLAPFDLVLCGRQAIDGDTAQVGPQIAEKLAINQLTGVTGLREITPQAITVSRAVDGGRQVVRSRLPVLLTVTAEAPALRPPSVKRVMAYKAIERRACGLDYAQAYLEPGTCRPSHIREWNLETIGADPALCGLSGSPTKVKQVQNVVLTAGGARMLCDDAAEIGALVRELKAEHIIG
jgi:electron transfer flavoprotein beta subunit